MNHIYRLVWNAASNLWVVAAENARGKSKAGTGRNSGSHVKAAGGFALNTACKAALLMLAVGAQQAHAADAANANVSAGAATVGTVGNTTTINQASQRAAIDWTSLSTRANEALIFNQPNAQAIALNRITGSSPSELLGSLTANGQVFILNPNGVLFGAGSQVNVGGLVASTLNMSNADFMAGNNVFSNNGSSASVVNQGTLNAGQGGYLALLAPEVRNEGVMTASLGTALLAAGNKVTLNLDNGSLLGYSIDQGAINALAENKHLIQANGGQVLLSAKAMDSLTTATVNNTGVIEARTLQNKAGRIMLMGDMETGTVNVGGTLDASAPNGGDGGFIETSAAHVKIADGAAVTTLAASGNHGTWLIDPKDYTIADSGGDMTGAQLGNFLNAGNVVIQSVNGAGGVNGDVNVNAAVTWSAPTMLTLNAYRNINLNASITSQHAIGKLALEYGQGAASAGNTAAYNVKAPVNLKAGDNFSTKLGSDGATLQYKVITSLGAANSTTGTDLQGMRGNLAGRYVLGSDIDASATAGWNSGQGFTPVGNDWQSFIGSFDGLGHVVDKLFINRPTTDDVGLFGYVKGVTLRNVGVTNANITGQLRVGSLAGSFFDSNLDNSYASGNVVGKQSVGGLIGSGKHTRDLSFTISNSHTSTDVMGAFYVGGLVGSADSDIIGSYATGNVTGSADQIGGLAGRADGNISNSYATGHVQSTKVPDYPSDTSAVGGLVGVFAGVMISNSYSTGSVTAISVAGGLVGSSFGTIRDSYSTSFVSANRIGGLLGFSGGYIERSFWRAGLTPNAVGMVVSGWEGKIDSVSRGLNRTEQFLLATYLKAGWDISTDPNGSSVWVIYDGRSMPILRSSLPKSPGLGLGLGSFVNPYPDADIQALADADLVLPYVSSRMFISSVDDLKINQDEDPDTEALALNAAVADPDGGGE